MLLVGAGCSQNPKDTASAGRLEPPEVVSVQVVEEKEETAPVVIDASGDVAVDVELDFGEDE